MPASLLDVNVWLAVGFEAHPAHLTARGALLQASGREPALWCRATQQSFLRLASNPVILAAYQVPRATNRDALAALQAFLALPQVDLAEEPPALEGLWWRLAGMAEAAPKRWMDAYLAAFAIAGSYRLISLDQDFRQFRSFGLDLLLLEADSASSR